MAPYEPSHLDLNCLQRYLYWSAGMKGLNLYWAVTQSCLANSSPIYADVECQLGTF